ncbi:MAG: hypothetical protein ACKVQS_13960 [Fimbriimonadaceae bacterium]
MPYFPNHENSPDIRTIAVYFFGGAITLSLICIAYTKAFPPQNSKADIKSALGCLVGALILAAFTYFAARWTADSEY